jgi:subtilase family serine protease
MHLNKIPRHRPRPAGPPRRRPRRWPWLAAAPLAACLTAACASAALGGTAGSAAPAPLNCAPSGLAPEPCYSPRAYQAAYGVAPLLRRGITGRGETVAIFALAQTPASHGSVTDIRRDLAAFDTTFGLPRARLHAVTAVAGSPTPYLSNVEELGDAEMVHAFAPGATLDIILVPADAVSSPANFAAAITKAVRESAALHAAVLSISAGGGERAFTRGEVAAMHAALEQARDQHVTVLGSSGDGGALPGGPVPASAASRTVQVSMPTADPLVLGVGGTLLDTTPGGAYLGEMAWNDNTEGSGGGYSALFPRPSYQDSLARARATRGVPDVSANADPYGQMAVEWSFGQLRGDTGTSSSAPLWAGVIALADQQAGRHLGFVNPALYAIGRSRAYHRAFHDVITGGNSVVTAAGVCTGYNAGPGWDPVTGWGSPDAQYLVPLLARTARATSFSRASRPGRPGLRPGR